MNGRKAKQLRRAAKIVVPMDGRVHYMQHGNGQIVCVGRRAVYLQMKKAAKKGEL